MVIPALSSADRGENDAPISSLRAGSILKLKSAKGSIPYGAAKKGTVYPKIVIGPEILAKDMTEARVNSFVSACYSGEKISHVASLVMSSLSRVNGRDHRPLLKVFSRNTDIGKDESQAAAALYKLIQQDMPVNWPFDGRVEEDVESFVIDQKCLQKSFTALYNQLSKDSMHCEVHFDPASAAEGKSLDLKTIQEIALKDPKTDAQGWTDFPVSRPKGVQSFSCPGTVKTISDLGAIIDVKSSYLKVGRAGETANITLQKSEDDAGSTAVNIGTFPKEIPGTSGTTLQTDDADAGSVESDDAQ